MKTVIKNDRLIKTTLNSIKDTQKILRLMYDMEFKAQEENGRTEKYQFKQVCIYDDGCYFTIIPISKKEYHCAFTIRTYKEKFIVINSLDKVKKFIHKWLSLTSKVRNRYERKKESACTATH